MHRGTGCWAETIRKVRAGEGEPKPWWGEGGNRWKERAKGRLALLPREGSVVATGLRAQPSRANQTLSQDSTIFSSKDSNTGGLSACFSHQAEWRDYQTLQSRNPRDWPASGQTTSVGGGCGFL